MLFLFVRFDKDSSLVAVSDNCPSVPFQSQPWAIRCATMHRWWPREDALATKKW